METLNKNITIYERTKHGKASEEYIHCLFKYPTKNWDGWVPVVYRRTGLYIEEGDTEKLNTYLNKVYNQLDPNNYEAWLQEQKQFWKEFHKPVTKTFFDALIKGGWDAGWKCQNCDLPSNPNFARRIQDLKESGYTIATDSNRYCPHCQQNKTHLLLLPIKRGSIDGNGYETWSKELRNRILKVLGKIDVYENKPNVHSLPDHKFSEIRWDKYTKALNPDSMSDEEIKEKFQLLSNQRNEEKREVCRKCFQTGKRGIIFGIPFFYSGNENWDESIPKTGKDAELGCVGCPWYDIARWRKELMKKLYDSEE